MKREFFSVCKECNGHGNQKIVVDGQKILSLTEDSLGDKINAIKAVRAEFPILTLREAKYLVEHSIYYIDQMRHSLNTVVGGE